MISDSIPKASIALASSNPKDFAKKKRVCFLMLIYLHKLIHALQAACFYFFYFGFVYILLKVFDFFLLFCPKFFLNFILFTGLKNLHEF